MRCFFVFVTISLVTGLYAQPTAIRQKIQQEYTTEEAKKVIQALAHKNKMAQQQVVDYINKHKEMRAHFVDETNYYQAQRMERNSVIYFKTHNDISRWVSGVEEWMASANPALNQLVGQGMLVGVIDGDLAFDRHVEFGNRSGSKVHVLDTWNENLNEASQDFATIERRRNHATHVVGTIIAQGKNPKARGLAPEAEVYSYTWTNDIAKMGYLAQQGVLVTNHSYGIAAVDDKKRPLVSTDYFGAYSIDAVNMDKIAYLYPYLQPVVAAGNDKGEAAIINPSKDGMDLLLGHANAKNAIVVGAVGVDDLGIIRETAYSSNGPTNDFRIKPDIVAIGDKVYSSAYQYRFNEGEIEKNNLYAVLSGTSMAAPSVAAILVLWQQWALEYRKFPYKAATLKGIMINSATYLPEQTSPNARTGWGIINAWNGVQFLEASKQGKAIIQEEYLKNKQEKRFQVELTEEVNRLSFTLAWTDVEGKYTELNFKEEHQVKKLVNDLDLRVYKDGNVFFPWHLAANFAKDNAVQGDNAVDNVERIDLVLPELGTYEVRISHKGNLVNKIQDYSLLVNSDTYSGVKMDERTLEERVIQLVAWPNPVEEVLHIEIPSDVVFSTLEAVIHDSTGRQLQVIPLAGSNRQNLNVSFLPPGLYFLEVKGGSKKYQIKFLKK